MLGFITEPLSITKPTTMKQSYEYKKLPQVQRTEKVIDFFDSSLPVEIILNIMKFMTPEELVALCRSSRSLDAWPGRLVYPKDLSPSAVITIIDVRSLSRIENLICYIDDIQQRQNSIRSKFKWFFRIATLLCFVSILITAHFSDTAALVLAGALIFSFFAMGYFEKSGQCFFGRDISLEANINKLIQHFYINKRLSQGNLKKLQQPCIYSALDDIKNILLHVQRRIQGEMNRFMDVEFCRKFDSYVEQQQLQSEVKETSYDEAANNNPNDHPKFIYDRFSSLFTEAESKAEIIVSLPEDSGVSLDVKT